MINGLKTILINRLVSAKKPLWQPGNKLKVAIALNQYFTIESWNDVLKTFMESDITNWDIIFCRNKIDIYRHVPGADICFLYGLGEYLNKQLYTKKMVYFPLLGLDFLNKLVLPEDVNVMQPPPYSSQSIAEYCVAMAILLTRNLQYSFNNRCDNEWDQTKIIHQSINSIKQCKIGVLGLGKIGIVIAKNFNIIGCDVIGCDKVAPSEKNILSTFYDSGKLHDFIKNIDILIIALPLNNTTKKIIDTNALKALGPKKYIINISRGEIIDEKALIHALSTNAIKGAALDVFENEPLSGNSKLYQCKNAIITPHIAGNLNLFVNEIQQDFVRKALEYNRNV
jgi:phosphoglycerate dehydrogenase-like enzyme